MTVECRHEVCFTPDQIPPRVPRMASRTPFPALAVVLLLGLNSTLPAQSVEVIITPGSGSAFTGQLAVTIEWCSHDAELDGSRIITLNGQDVVNNFNWSWSSLAGCVRYATSSGTVTLVVGNNVLYAAAAAEYEPPPQCPPDCEDLTDPPDTLEIESMLGARGPRSGGVVSASRGADLVWGNSSSTWNAVNPSYSVAVTPDDSTASRPVSAGPFTESFTVKNTGNVFNTFTLSCAATPPLTATCTPSQPTVGLPPNGTANPTVSYTTGSSLGIGMLTLTASGSGGAVNTGSYNVHVITFGVEVVPEIAYGSARLAYGQPNDGHEPATGESFTVRNTGTGPQTYSFAADHAGPILGTLTPPNPITLAAGQTGVVVVGFTEGTAPGVESIRLTASNNYASDDGVVMTTIHTLPAQEYGLITASIFPPNTVVGIRTINVHVHTCTRSGIDYPVNWTFKLNGVDIKSQFDGPYPSEHPDCFQTTGGDPVPELYVGTVTLQMGTNTFVVQGLSSDQFPYSGGSSATWTVPLEPVGVVVTREAQYIEVPPSVADTVPFRVRNAGISVDSFDISVTCTGAAAAGSCTKSTPRVVLQPNAESVVTVIYTSNATLGDSGKIQLVAKRVEIPQVSDTNTTEITVAPAPSAGVVLFGSGPLIERDLCVIIALGSDAASECGDLRLAHLLPVTSTLNRAWSPTLIYNSQHASPRPLVQADVTLPTGSTDSVEAILRVGGVEMGRGKWAGWPGLNTRRIAVADTTGTLTTGVHAFTLEVRRKSGSWSTFSTPAGDLAVVRRDASRFGAGWWLAGLERLDSLTATTKLWTGGDGSLRRYAPAGTNKWAAPNLDRPDTLKLEGSFYVRYLPNNLRVKFEASTGRHRLTVDRLNRATAFNYDACGRLSAIKLPPDTTSRVYTFTYQSATCTDLVVSITAPAIGATPRVVTITTSGGRVQSIQDPDTGVVALAYESGTNRVISRTNRRNKVTTYSYNAGKRVSGFQLPIWSSPVAVYSAETRGLAALGAAAPLDSAYSGIDGPRTDVGDVTKFWVNRYGAPVRTRNAVGGETVITYDVTWPGHPKRMRGPNRLTSDIFYNSRALADSIKVWSPLGDARNAVTKYFWNTTWASPDTVISPMGVKTKFGYDASGNRLWEQLGSNSARRVHYTYQSQGLVTSVLAPLSAPESLYYDALGNLRKTRSPLGHLALVFRDAIGRDTLAASNPRDTIPSDSTSVRNNGVRARTQYDIVDQVRKSITWSGSVSIVAHRPGSSDTTRVLPADTIRLEHTYDKEGNLTGTTRFYSIPGTSSLNAVPSGWEYDDANRRVTSTSPTGAITIDSLDPAGNAVTVTTPRGFKIRSRFDAMNRPVRRITPQVAYGNSTQLNPPAWYSFPFRDGPGLCVRSDTASFDYNDAGQMTRADNYAARISRAYTPNGLPTSETQVIRTYMGEYPAPCEPLPSGGLEYTSLTWYWHNYTVRSTYDLDSRRDTLVHPTNLCAGCFNRFTYEPERGLLSQVRDISGALTNFTYDDAARLSTIQHPGGAGITRTHTFDVEGRVKTRASIFVNDSLWYDAAGRVVRANVTAAPGQQRTPQMIYAPIGPLVFSSGLSAGAMYEEFDPDAIGNRKWQRDYGFDPSYTDRRRLLTHDSYGRLTQEDDLPPAPGYYDLSRSTDYDLSGNVKQTWGWERKQPNVTTYDETRSYYSADEKLAAFNRHIGQGPASEPGGVFEQYRYDALGRRVFVRSRLTTDCAATNGGACGYVERTVWDGSQILYEIRAPGGDAASLAIYMEQDGYTLGGIDEGHFGIVGYTHAGGIDQPLAIHHRSVPNLGAVTIIPHANWQGDFAFGTKADGSECTTACYNINWPGGRASADEQLNSIANPWWWGSLIGHQGDGSGLQYMRNRYYDPQTGKFTQEDPLGLAGGLNLYGFAAGDPVNYSDPFGLSPCNNLPAQACKGWRRTLQQAEEFWNDMVMSGIRLSRRIMGFFAVGDATTAVTGVDENGDKVSTGGRVLAGAMAASGPVGQGFKVAGQLETIWSNRRLFTGWLKGSQSAARIGNPLSHTEARQIIDNARRLGIENFDFNPAGLQGLEKTGRWAGISHFKIGSIHIPVMPGFVQ